ncbi:MAG TPA: hypothetical protein VJR50_19030 [Mycobacterium sp.]|jgi:hypothetical protein|nr:hypothetical protein [Mycobacterium sp.]
MASIQVDVAGIGALAAHCQTLASEIGGASGATPSLPSGQATATAVHTVHADVAAAGAAMVARLQNTSATLTAAARSFATQETESADALGGVASAPAV